LIGEEKTMRLISLAVLFAAVCGCTPSRHVQVTGWSDGSSLTPKSYALVPGKDVAPGDLNLAEFSKYAKNMLEDAGYRETSPEKADTIITLSYGIDGRVQTYPRSEPYYYNAHPTTTIFDPQRYTVMGAQGYPGTLDSYVRYLRLAAYDKEAGGTPGRQRWHIDSTTLGPSSDLQKVVPFMAAGTHSFIGKDTGGEKDLTVRQTDLRYKIATGARL
jgi:hypothetical protein